MGAQRCSAAREEKRGSTSSAEVVAAAAGNTAITTAARTSPAGWTGLAASKRDRRSAISARNSSE
jgi:hypothetical protein